MRMSAATRATAVFVTAIALACTLGEPVAHAGTAFDNTAPYSASTALNHRITYPRFLRFRVGPAAGIALVTCNMSAVANALGTGVDQACTGGDLGGGASTVEVKSNAGQVRLTVTTTGAMQNAAGNTIPYSEIKSASSNPGNLPAPVLTTGAVSPAVNVALNAGVVTDRAATWTYTYDNSAVYPAGTYGGVNVRRGRVTYTAAAP
jgi:hypothetical protein